MAFGLNPTPGRSPNLSKVDPRLVSIVAGGAAGLPDGYRVTVNEGYNAGGHVAHSQHHIAGKGALDVTIWDPSGRAIPNEGKDTTGMYGNLARLSYGYMLQNYPDLKGKFASGMSFETKAGSGKADLMHFDLGGERGRPSPWAGKGPFVPPMNVGQTAQGRQMALGEGRGRINSGPQVRQLQEQLAAKGYSPGKIDGIYGPKTATAVRNFETDNHLNVDKGVAGPQVLAALNAPPAYAPGGSVPPQGFPTAWGPQPPQMGPESGADPLYGRKVPTSTIGPPTIPGSPPPMGPGLPTYDPGNNALESAMGPSTAPPAVEPLSAGLQRVIDRGSYREQRGFKAPPIASFSGSATAIGGAPQTGGGMSADLTPRPGTVDDTPYDTRLLYDHDMGWPGAGQPPAGSPDVPVASNPLSPENIGNALLGPVNKKTTLSDFLFGPVGSDPAAASSPAPTTYDKIPPAVSDPNRFTPSDLTPWAPGFGQQSSAGGGRQYAGGVPDLRMGGAAPSMLDMLDGPPIGPQDMISDRGRPANQQATFNSASPMGSPNSEDAFGTIPQDDLIGTVLGRSQFHGMPDRFYTPGWGHEDFPGQADYWTSHRLASADPNFMPDFNGNTKPDIYGNFTKPGGGIIPTGYSGGFNKPISDDFVNQETSIGLPRDPLRADQNEIGMPWGALPSRYNDPGYRPVDQRFVTKGPIADAGSGFGGAVDAFFNASPDLAAAAAAPTIGPVDAFGPAGGAPAISAAPYMYGSGDASIGGGMGGGVSSLFQPLPAPDLTVSSAGNATDRTNKAVQAIQQATQGGGSSGGAGRGGSPISPTSYGGSPGSYAYMGSTPWGGSIYQTPSGGPSYSPYTPSNYTAPNFTNGSGGALYSYHPDGNGGGTYINSFGQTMSY